MKRDGQRTHRKSERFSRIPQSEMDKDESNEPGMEEQNSRNLSESDLHMKKMDVRILDT